MDAVKCALALDHDGVWIPFGGFSGLQPDFLEENVYRDDWGKIYRKNAASWPIDAPIENILEMFRVGREYGQKYFEKEDSE